MASNLVLIRCWDSMPVIYLPDRDYGDKCQIVPVLYLSSPPVEQIARPPAPAHAVIEKAAASCREMARRGRAMFQISSKAIASPKSLEHPSDKMQVAQVASVAAELGGVATMRRSARSESGSSHRP